MEMKELLLLLSMLVHFGTTLWNWLEKRGDKTNVRIAEMQTALQEIELDVRGLKESRNAAPTHHDLGEVYKSINRLSATVHELVGENRSQTDQLRLIVNKMTGGGHA